MTIHRAIVVYHPDFDSGGREGIEAAKKIAEDMQKGQTEYLQTLRLQNAPPQMIQAADQFLSQMKYLIRKVDF